MSVRVTSFYWDSAPQIDGNDKMLMLCLADWCNDDGYCYYGMERICKRMGREPRTVQTIIKSLEDRNELLVCPGQGQKTATGTTNRYYLLGYCRANNISIPNDAIQAAKERRQQQRDNGRNGLKARKGVQNPAPQGVQNPAPQGVQNPAPQGVQNPAPQGVQNPAPNTSVDPFVDPSVDPLGDARVDDLTEPPEPPTPPTLSQSDVAEFVNATNLPAHALSPVPKPPFQPVLTDSPTGPKRSADPHESYKPSKELDARKIGSDRLIPKGKGETVWEIWRESFTWNITAAQNRDAKERVKDLNRWRVITAECALRDFKSYTNVMKVYLEGFLDGTHKPEGAANASISRSNSPTRPQTIEDRIAQLDPDSAVTALILQRKLTDEQCDAATAIMRAAGGGYKGLQQLRGAGLLL